MLLKKLFNGYDRDRQKRAAHYTDLIRREAKIGASVFGPVPQNVRREFFCLDEHTWVWHEQWHDKTGQTYERTTNYSIRPDGILKSGNQGHYQRVNPKEAYRLYQAAKLYSLKVSQSYVQTNA
jgi:hypothetical protein